MIVALIKEPIDLQAIPPALPSLLYGGIGAVGIAYTLHVVALKDANPAYASLILSTESVFGALGGWLILHETMTSRQILGAVLIMGAVVLTQVRRSNRTYTRLQRREEHKVRTERSIVRHKILKDIENLK